MKTKHLSLKKAVEERLQNPEFRLHFEQSRSISALCAGVCRARQVVGLSQVALAKKVGTTQSVIARLENGNQGRMPSLELLGRVARALRLQLVVGFEKAAA